LLALLAGFAPAVFGLWSGAAESICNLDASGVGREFHVRARYFGHAHGVLLKDPSCPDRTLYLRASGKLTEFTETVDPEGKRFGIPLGAGTYVDIELYGRLGENGLFFAESVEAYDRHDVLDSRWRVQSIEDGVGVSGWQADEQFPFTVNKRVLKTAANETVVYATLGDEDVGELLKLSNAAVGTLCKVSESAQSLVRLQCAWMGRTRDMRSWVYAREANSWRLVAKTDGVRL
jgi:hypothetical protein